MKTLITLIAAALLSGCETDAQLAAAYKKKYDSMTFEQQMAEIARTRDTLATIQQERSIRATESTAASYAAIASAMSRPVAPAPTPWKFKPVLSGPYYGKPKPIKVEIVEPSNYDSLDQ